MLSNVYVNLNRERNARRVYMKLQQNVNQFFNVFYSKFKKQINYFHYNDKTLIDNLKEKIFMKLKEALSITVTRFDIVFELKNYLQTVNNNQRDLSSNQTCIERIRAVKFAFRVSFITASIFLSNFFNRVFLRSIFTFIFSINLVMTQLIIHSRLLKVIAEEKCFTCKKLKHIVVDYSQKKSKFNYLFIRIQKIDIKIEKSKKKNYDYDLKN